MSTVELGRCESCGANYRMIGEYNGMKIRGCDCTFFPLPFPDDIDYVIWDRAVAALKHGFNLSVRRVEQAVGHALVETGNGRPQKLSVPGRFILSIRDGTDLDQLVPIHHLTVYVSERE